MSTWSGPMWKESRTARKKAKARDRGKLAREENKNKATVRRRDKRCRFPLCGCRKLGLSLKSFGEVSHLKHKSMGGNPSGDRSLTAGLILLCKHRHQDGAISRHKQTLRTRALTSDGYDGPIAWEIDMGEFERQALPAQERTARKTDWRELAREKAIGVLDDLADWQRETLDELAEMEL